MPGRGAMVRDYFFAVHVQGYQSASLADMQVSEAQLYRACLET
jgi:hypothetical protein